MSAARNHESPTTFTRETDAKGRSKKNNRPAAGNPFWHRLAIHEETGEAVRRETRNTVRPEPGGAGTLFLKSGLKVGAPDDSFEREADRVADRVMAMPDSGIRRKPS